MAGFMSRLGAMVNPFDEESRSKRADRSQRQQDLGSQFHNYPIEQAQMAQEQYENAAPQSGPPSPEAAGRRDVAQTTAEGVIQKGSEGGRTGIDMANFDPSNAESVRQMQRMLNQAGFKDQSGEALGEDGKMGAKTTAALRRAQGMYRDDYANMGELKGGQGAFGDQTVDDYTRINQKGKEHLAGREGRGDSIVPTHDPEGLAGWSGLTNEYADFEPNTREREQAVGWGRGKAKGIDDAIEQSAPWLANSSAYRGAKSGIKSFFDKAGDSDY